MAKVKTAKENFVNLTLILNIALGVALGIVILATAIFVIVAAIAAERFFVVAFYEHVEKVFRGRHNIKERLGNLVGAIIVLCILLGVNLLVPIVMIILIWGG